jgi:quercetin dioxygenase-like cupin family protein
MTTSKSIVVARRSTVAAGLFALALFSTPAPVHRAAAAIAPAARNVMAAYGAEVVTIDRTMRDYRTPDQLPWKGREGSVTKNAAVFGDSSKAGMYVQLLKRGPNDWSEAHSHPKDRYITVLEGTFLIGTGSKVDRKNTVALGPGSIVHDIAGQMHYDGTGPEGATIEIMGMGPATRIASESK